MRAPGMTWFRLPLFVWAHLCDEHHHGAGHAGAGDDAAAGRHRARRSGIGIFDPALGGDPMLFQHLFWFYSHPAVYIMVLPAMGVVSEIITCFARKKIFGYTFMVYASVGHRGDRIPGLGPSHVRVGPVDVCRTGVFVAEFPGRGAVGDQGVQLDGDAVQGIDHVRGADALRARLHRAVH